MISYADTAAFPWSSLAVTRIPHSLLLSPFNPDPAIRGSFNSRLAASANRSLPAVAGAPVVNLPAPRLPGGTVVERCPRKKPAFSGIRAQTLFHRFEIFIFVRRAPPPSPPLAHLPSHHQHQTRHDAASVSSAILYGESTGSRLPWFNPRHHSYNLAWHPVSRRT